MQARHRQVDKGPHARGLRATAAVVDIDAHMVRHVLREQRHQAPVADERCGRHARQLCSHPTPTDADNPSGSLPAARNDWRISDADSMSARTKLESTLDAGYTTAGASPTAKLSVSFLHLWGSPYRKGQISRRSAFICFLLSRQPFMRASTNVLRSEASIAPMTA